MRCAVPFVACVAALGCNWTITPPGPPMPAPAAAALDGAETFELLSLSPEALKEPPEDAFQRWKVLGSTTVTDPAVRTRLITAFKQGVQASDGTVAGCFNPRHGIRVTTKGVTTEFVICFECLQVQVNSGGTGSSFLTTASPQVVFNEVLDAAGVPRARKAD